MSLSHRCLYDFILSYLLSYPLIHGLLVLTGRCLLRVDFYQGVWNIKGISLLAKEAISLASGNVPVPIPRSIVEVDVPEAVLRTIVGRAADKGCCIALYVPI